MPRWNSIVTAVPVALALVACVEDPDLGQAEQEALCPLWGCGENSPLMGPYGEHEYDWTGTVANAEGSRITRLVQGTESYRPRIVEGNRLIAEHANGTVLQGTQLEGAYFLVMTPTEPYKIIIHNVTPRAVSPVRFWIGPQLPIETYELRYTKLRSAVTHPEPLCKNPPARDSGEGDPSRLWHAPLEAILFTGDRYTSGSKEVIASSYSTAGTFFNIACAGSAIAKLHLARYTTASSAPPMFTSTAPERQAMLKMYSGDFCGNGNPWTEQGTKLRWQNPKNWSVFSGSEFAQESLWGPQGALCLDTHRLGQAWKNDVLAACPVVANTACPNVAPGGALPWGAYVATAVPQDPDAP